jgi:hypothetical protein
MVLAHGLDRNLMVLELYELVWDRSICQRLSARDVWLRIDMSVREWLVSYYCDISDGCCSVKQKYTARCHPSVHIRTWARSVYRKGRHFGLNQVQWNSVCSRGGHEAAFACHLCGSIRILLTMFGIKVRTKNLYFVGIILDNKNYYNCSENIF